jgi:hypothetical protein
MKIFFVGSQRDKKVLPEFRKIAAKLESFGNKVTTLVINEADTAEVMELDRIFQKHSNAIKKSDFVVAETTISSSGLGFIIASALNEKKPVLALSKHNGNGKAALNLKANTSRSKLLTCKEYSPEQLDALLDDFLGAVKKILDTKFILIISPEIDGYLQWASDNRRMHKAQVVRRAVEEVMRNDKEYKKHLSSEKRKKA